MASDEITVFEVGPRDGLQNESARVTHVDKVELIYGLVAAGLRQIEVGAFVRPDRVPQMADTDRLFGDLRSLQSKFRSVRLWSLVPNKKGLERAVAAGARSIAVFTAATESFAQANIGMSIRESLDVCRDVIGAAQKMGGIKVRGYVSTAFGCPFEGKVSPKKALAVIEKLGNLGVQQVSVGDTIGVATPNQMNDVMKPALKMLGVKRIAGHFHDTRGTALANTLRAIELGVTTFDSSAGGLGGCPFAPGAAGNLATEDLVHMLSGMGLKTGVDLDRLCQVSLRLAHRMKRPVTSRYLQSYASGLKLKIF